MERPMGKKQFGEAMARSGFEVEKRHDGWGRKGIELKPEFAPSFA